MELFDEYRSMFYTDLKRGSKDRVPENINTLCYFLSSKLTLAVWFLDDGALRTDSKAYRLHTEGFPREVVEVLKTGLLVNYGLECTLNHHRNKGSNSYKT